MIKKSMPPLRTLQVFEAAARHQSFTAAGYDIGITQSAVSRQIADLEAHLGQVLFIRSGPNLSLTAIGAKLAKGIGHALMDMRLSVEDAQTKPRSNVITLTMLPSVAAKWMAPRLERFIQTHPDIDLRISATRDLIDLMANDVDAAIRYGKGAWTGMVTTHLASEVIQPVCSPEYARKNNFSTPDDLLSATLLYGDIEEDWQKWFVEVGLKDVSLPRGPELGDDTAILQAALDHQGVALGRSMLIANDLKLGRLITPFKQTLNASYSYWFVCPVSTVRNTSLIAVENWFIREFG